MASTNNSLCVTSYNSTGFGLSAQNHLKSLLIFSDICCVQEHFILDCKDKKRSNTDIIRKCFGASHDMFITPAVKSSDSVSRGRGSGGLVTMWQKGLTKYVNKVSCSNFRIQGIHVSFWNLLVVNFYFPFDPQN